jgi:hypothetical protein
LCDFYLVDIVEKVVILDGVDGFGVVDENEEASFRYQQNTRLSLLIGVNSDNLVRKDVVIGQNIITDRLNQPIDCAVKAKTEKIKVRVNDGWCYLWRWHSLNRSWFWRFWLLLLQQVIFCKM